MVKLQKISKIALNLLNVFKIFAILVLILGIAAPAVFFLFPEFSTPTSLLFGSLELTLNQPLQMAVPRIFSTGIFLISAASSAIGLYIISLLQKILKPMAAGEPFHNEIAPAIQKIAWLHVITACLSQIIECAVTAFTFYRLNMGTLLLNSNITAAGLNLEFNCNFLFTFGILLLLSYVFEYGQQLQQLSDETV